MNEIPVSMNEIPASRPWEESLEEMRKHAERLPAGSTEREEADKKVFALTQAIDLRNSLATGK